ncbi:MAG: hypothetical protein WCV93_04815 [Candidatus Shapirobacteria bacterium]|jgi:hypothetical protein
MIDSIRERLFNSAFTSYMDGVLSPPPEFEKTTRKLEQLYGLATGYLSQHPVNPDRKWATLDEIQEKFRYDFPDNYHGHRKGSPTPASAIEIWQFEQSDREGHQPVAISIFQGIQSGTSNYYIYTLVIFPSVRGNTGVAIWQNDRGYKISGLTELQPDESMAIAKGVYRNVSGAIKGENTNTLDINGGVVRFRQTMETIVYNFCYPSSIASDGK